MNILKKIFKLPYYIYQSITIDRVKDMEDETYFSNLEQYAQSRVAEIEDSFSLFGFAISRDILYVGCGDGTILSYLKQKYNNFENIKGIDINPHAVKLAKEKYIDICFEKNDIKMMDFNDYDTIFDYASFMYLKPKELLHIVEMFYANSKNKYLIIMAMPIRDFRKIKSYVEVIIGNRNLTVWGTYRHDLNKLINLARQHKRGGVIVTPNNGRVNLVFYKRRKSEN